MTRKRFYGLNSHTKIAKETRPRSDKCGRCLEGRYIQSYGSWICHACGHGPDAKIVPDRKLARQAKNDQRIAKDLKYLDDITIDEILKNDKSKD